MMMHCFTPLKFTMIQSPQNFEKWIDSIDQATHITGRDLRKELLKKSDVSSECIIYDG